MSDGVLWFAIGLAVGGVVMRLLYGHPPRDAAPPIDPRDVHEAMQDAPHDGLDFRMARAALKFIQHKETR